MCSVEIRRRKRERGNSPPPDVNGVFMVVATDDYLRERRRGTRDIRERSKKEERELGKLLREGLDYSRLDPTNDDKEKR